MRLSVFCMRLLCQMLIEIRAALLINRTAAQKTLKVNYTADLLANWESIAYSLARR